jgi:hypothetical protein
MVFMRRDEGHPLGATLVLASMLAFALVFHVVTRPDTHLAAQFNVSLAPFSVSVPAPPPVVWRPTIARPEAVIVAAPVSPAVAEDPVEAAPAAMPVLSSVAWPAAPHMMPSTAHDVSPATPTREGGAVTRAIASTRSAVRNALSRAF